MNIPDDLKPIHEFQVYAVVLLTMFVALAAAVGTATWAVLKHGAVT